jgi:hypothetical protein
MLRYLLALILVFCGSFYRVSAQIKQDTLFPTYRQIKPTQNEIIDYRPNADAYSRSRRINIFDYPAGTVTYYLNEQPTSDINYVKQVLANKSVSVETISISPPDKQGKRQIRITYTVEGQ